MPVTIAPMPRKPRKDPADAKPAGETEAVRIDRDLARMANLVATATNRSVSEVLSPHIRAGLMREYARVIQGLAKEVEDPDA